MDAVAVVLVALVAALHLYFLVLEMFLWDKPLGRRTFGMTPDKAAATKPLAMNQGLYNGFLAAGHVCTDAVARSAGRGSAQASRRRIPATDSRSRPVRPGRLLRAETAASRAARTPVYAAYIPRHSGRSQVPG
mgnify:CR=1 FL=1